MNRKSLPSSALDRIHIRMSDGLRDRIKSSAKDANRSMNAEIVHRLESSFEAASNLHSDIAVAIERHVQAEVSARLRRIAESIGGGS